MNSYDLLIQFLGILTGLAVICFAVLYFWLRNNQPKSLKVIDRRQLNREVVIERRIGERRKRPRNQVYLGWPA